MLFLRGATGEHLIAGFPSCPSGHEHIGRCAIGLHIAVGAHTLGRSQGLWHSSFMHVSLPIQSLSDWHIFIFGEPPGSKLFIMCTRLTKLRVGACRLECNYN